MKTHKIDPVKEQKRYEIEVYVAYTDNLKPFVTAQLSGEDFYIPTGDVVERYVFEVERPKLPDNQNKLKGQL